MTVCWYAEGIFLNRIMALCKIRSSPEAGISADVAAPGQLVYNQYSPLALYLPCVRLPLATADCVHLCGRRLNCTSVKFCRYCGRRGGRCTWS